MNRKTKNVVNKTAEIQSPLLSLGNQGLLSYIKHPPIPPPIQLMKIIPPSADREYDTENETDAIISLLIGLEPEQLFPQLFSLANLLAESSEPVNSGVSYIRQYVDYRISEWQWGLETTDPNRFAGRYSYMPLHPLVSASPIGGHGLPPEYKTDDIPFLGPTRPILPGKGEMTPDDSVERIRNYQKDQSPDSPLRESRPIHRGETEIEMIVIDGKKIPYARIYLTVYAAEPDPEHPAHKDIIQQSDGRIRILTPVPSSSSSSSSPTPAEKVTYMNIGRPVRALQWVDNYLSQGRPDAHPIIRSILVPLEALDDILIRAVTQEDKKTFEGVDTILPRIENSDQPAAPNQYGLYASEIEPLAFKGSLVSFTESGQGPPLGGTYESNSALRERLGIPSLALWDHMWIKPGGGFYSGPEQGNKAKDLAEVIDIWEGYLKRQQLNQYEQKKLLTVLRQQHLLEDSKLLTAEFDPPLIAKISWFMRNMAAPWASLGAATGLLADDYDRLKYDTELRSFSGRDQNNFSRLPGLMRGPSGISGFGEIAGTELDQLLLNPSSLAPVIFIQTLLRYQPELESFFGEYSNIPEKLRFFEHAQLVLYQYLDLTENETDEKRLLKKSSVVKMILFHDMHKWSSRLQYSSAKRHRLEEGKAEHVLPSLEMTRYRLLWGTDTESGAQFRMARAMMDGDPIGTYIKSSKPLSETEKEAVKEFDLMARSAGIQYQDYYRFFLELLQFYMADSSSYAAALPYVSWDKRNSDLTEFLASKPSPGIKSAFSHESDKLKKGSFDFDTQITATHFLMAEHQEKKLQTLAELFAAYKEEADIEAFITSIINPRPQIERPECTPPEPSQSPLEETSISSISELFEPDSV